MSDKITCTDCGADRALSRSKDEWIQTSMCYNVFSGDMASGARVMRVAIHCHECHWKANKYGTPYKIVTNYLPQDESCT